MTKKELIYKVSQASGMTKRETRDFIECLVDVISEALLHNEKVCITDLGTFKCTQRAARVGNNPHTGESVPIPERTMPKFTPSAVLISRFQAEDDEAVQIDKERLRSLSD